MDFSTINLLAPDHQLTLLRSAMMTAAHVEASHLISHNYLGQKLAPVKKQPTSHRHSSGLHTHIWYEVCLQMAGHAVLETPHGLHRLDPPSVAILTPGMPHCERWAGPPYGHVLLWFALGPNLALCQSSLCHPTGHWDAQAPRWSLQSVLAGQLLTALQNTSPPTGLSASLEPLRTALFNALSELYHQVLHQPQPQASSQAHHATHRHHQTIHNLTLFIQQHLDQPVRLEQLASLVQLSPNHLNTLFRQTMGMPVHAWLIQQRMEKAKSLLQHSGAMVKQVALQVGYDDPLYFSRAFCRHFGYWPSDERQRIE